MPTHNHISTFSQSKVKLIGNKREMGPDASIQKLPASEKFLDISDKNLCFIPIKFSKKSKLATFILSKNQIHELPKNLKKLNTLIMSNNDLTEITSEMEDGLLSYPNIETIDFSYNLLDSFPNSIIAISSLKNVNLFGNQITSFDCSNSSFISLDLGNNQLTNVPKVPDTIQTLILDRNQIKEIQNLKNAQKLSKLCISLNKLQNIDPNLMFSALTTLDISRNNLTSLPNLIKVTPHLKQLDASNNIISNLPSFPRTITDIIASNNQIKEFPPNINQLTCLCSIDLSQNEIECIPQLPQSLTSLIVFDNKIKEAQNSLLPDLTKLYLMNNSLTEVPFLKGLFLTDYFLSSNKIQNIDCNALSKSTLRVDVTDNELEELPEGLFEPPPPPPVVNMILPNSLSSSNLNSNNSPNPSMMSILAQSDASPETTKINPNLVPTFKITHIFASQNNIKNLPQKFTESGLIFINISENPIQSLPDTMPPLLEQFYAEKCGLKEIPNPNQESDEIIELMLAFNNISNIQYFNQLMILNLANNQLKKFPKLPSTLISIDVSSNQIKHLPNDFNFLHLESFDISYNNLKSLPKKMNTPRLKTFKLRGNFKLKGNIECDSSNFHFPALGYLDITETNLKLPSSSKIDCILANSNNIIITHDRESSTSNQETNSSSNSSQSSKSSSKVDNENSNTTTTQKEMSNIFYYGNISNVAFSTYRSEKESFEDLVLIQKKDSAILTSLLDGRSGGLSAKNAYNELLSFIQKTPLQFNSQYFHNLCNSISDVIRDKTIFDGSSLAILFIQNNEAFFTVFGDIRIFISKGKPGEFRIVQDNLQSNRRSGNKTIGQVSMSQPIGDYLVYRNDVSLKPMNLVLESGDRFITIVSSSIYEMLTIKQLDEMFCNSNTAKELANSLKYSTIANVSRDNVSVIAIDLKQ